MKLVSFRTGSMASQPGMDIPLGIVPAAAVMPDGSGRTMADVLSGLSAHREAVDSALDEIAGDPDGALRSGRLLARDSVTLEVPLDKGALLVCAGGNYAEHMAEAGEELPEKPAWFIKNRNAIVATGESIVLPSRSPDSVDWEGELVVVFGRTCYDVGADDAMSYIAGYTILNDVSARDDVSGLAEAATPTEGRWAWTDMLLGKQFPTFGPLGPAIVTVDEIQDPKQLRIRTTVNDTVMQDGSVADMAVAIPELVEFLSRNFKFEPGDAISTGTPSGVGIGRTPPVYLRDGDVVRVEIPGIGTLENPVVAGGR